MTGAEWIADKINACDFSSDFKKVKATVSSENIVFVERNDEQGVYVGVVPIAPRSSKPLVGLEKVQAIKAEKPDITMIIAIPRGARWSGAAMRWLESEGVAFGGVGDLLSAIAYDDDMAAHRNKTLAFVNDGLWLHSHVQNLEWIDSGKVKVQLLNGEVIIVALEDAYDITMSVAREAASTLGKFDVLLKTNPNGSITSSGKENVERVGFETLKWGELFGYLAKRG